MLEDGSACWLGQSTVLVVQKPHEALTKLNRGFAFIFFT
jgi:hypothetical protein